MKVFGKLAMVSAFALTVFSAGAAAADCKSTCNTKYADCAGSSTSSTQCLSTWRTCKMQCSGDTAKIAPVAAAAAPQGGALQKAAVKKVVPAKK